MDTRYLGCGANPGRTLRENGEMRSRVGLGPSVAVLVVEEIIPVDADEYQRVQWKICGSEGADGE